MTTKWPFPTTMSEVINKIDDTITTGKDILSSLKDDWPFPTRAKVTGIAEPTQPITLTATQEGIKFVHFDEGDVVCTVAYRPCNPKKGLKMLEVAVSYKHPKDQFNRKIGARTAAERFLDGRTICVPLRGKTNFNTYWNLYHAFVVAADKQ
jgi:hypothetical protein